MRFTINERADLNYLAKIVEIREFYKHPDSTVERLKCCTIDGFNVITGIDSEPGFYVYFPYLSQINGEFLSYCNLYRHSEKNSNSEISGLFEDNGKVTIVKLKGVPSEGFIVEFSLFESWILSVTNKTISAIPETEFDSVEDGEKTFWVCKKYIPKKQGRGYSKGRKRDKAVNKTNIICDKQFRFHYNTIQLKRQPELIIPTGYIQISSKIHGTSGVSANILTYKVKPTWKDKLCKWLTGKPAYEYNIIYSSRKKIRNGTVEERDWLDKESSKDHDIWWHANRIVAPKLKKGMTAYYEIVGYQPDGSFIQNNYDYGCIPPISPDLMCAEENFRVRIYRVTYTSVDGGIFEFSARQVQYWCDAVGLLPVKELWYGRAMDLYKDLPIDFDWENNFINALSNDTNFYMEQNSPDCNNTVPHEGIVIRMDDFPNIAVKLKSFKFLSKIDSNEEVNIEDEN